MVSSYLTMDAKVIGTPALLLTVDAIVRGAPCHNAISSLTIDAKVSLLWTQKMAVA